MYKRREGKEKKKKMDHVEKAYIHFFQKTISSHDSHCTNQINVGESTKISKLLSQNLYVHVAPTIYSLSIVIMRVSI